VCGDANTNFAAAVAARKLHLTVGHVEAGLRSFDWSMPEEHNRVMIDHISELLFAPTHEERAHLEAEKVRGAIFVTGNTVVDALLQNSPNATDSSGLLKRLGLRPKEYILATVHREENVDDPARLKLLIEALLALGSNLQLPILFPVHPRTMGRLRSCSMLEMLQPPGVRVVAPLGYLDFLAAESNARLIATDSGGIQEEACVLHVPCITLRDNTERPETVEVGANIVTGLQSEDVIKGAQTLLARPNDWSVPIGDGHAAERIIDVVLDHL
jgi:UDP-N-acetylglucosamine 2-epimerase (non-hydrolysing)